jgi:purine-binding chemotaxis protein CheW
MSRPGALLSIVAGGQAHAVNLQDLREIIVPPALATIPLAPASLLGLANWRGTVLPILDLGLLLGGQASVRPAGARVLVARDGAGFLVDACLGTTAARAADDASGRRPLDLCSLAAGTSPPVPDENHRRPQHRSAWDQRRGSADAPAEAGEPILVFWIGDGEYAVVLEAVEAVAAFTPSGAGAGQAGAASVRWRDQDLPLASLRPLLAPAGATPAAGREQRMVVLRLSDGTLSAMAVDRFAGILRVGGTEHHALPPLLRRGARPEVSSICRLEGGARLVCVLSPDRVFGRAYAAAHGSGRRGGGEPHAAPGAPTRYLVVRVGAARLAVPLLRLDEVVQLQGPLVRVAGNAVVDGLCHLRGGVLPVIDLARCLNLRGMPGTGARPAGAKPAGAKLLVQNIAGSRTGFCVDAVEGVLAVAAEAIAPPPDWLGGAAPLLDSVLASADGAVVPVLDLARIPGAGDVASLVGGLLAAAPPPAADRVAA